ncbi:hypothetical protein [Bacteroides caecigallinarum]|uniref:hypothetical protein n=1 Tax=Bacteroides caecigallinarum TaxID=1411144 RepID=UPI001959F645|nr:hypothetical protein [Bacteroides caecigallinarum]MBM6882028.1 hypothetical protein [Bacteroides caecigallinarum]
MRKKLYFHHLLLGMAIFMGSCSENEDSIPANPGDAISFSAATPQSRTYYSEWLQLDWEEYDQIGIYSAEANALDADINKPKNAVYEITNIYKDEPGHYHHADFEAVGDDRLKWGSYNDHTFYGAYPAERIETYPNEGDMKGMFEMKYMTNQVCSVSSLTSPYKTTPDMKNAYMVAKNTLPPTSDKHVLLTFRPVMTTLQINVTAGSTGSDIGTGIIPGPTTITGVSVIMPRALNNGEFLYDVDNGYLKEGSVLDDTKESVFVSFNNNNGERYIKLNAEEKISFLVFLPPVLMDVSRGDTAKLRIHTTGYQNYVIPMNGNLQQEYKFDIKLPDFDPERIQPNNWMSYMDDKVYVSQLSIPGSYRNLQSIPAGNLLNMGVRALDLRSAGDEMNTIIEEIESFLGKNSQEFVIALCGDGSTVSSTKKIDFKADMTLAEARGSILFINENMSGITFNKDYSEDKYNENEAKYVIDNLRNNVSRAWTVTYCAYDNMPQDIVKSSNKAIYDHIVNTQEGNTGIVMIPYACTENVVGEPEAGKPQLFQTYGDLFTQSIIDCNFKFIHQFANK